MLAALLVVLLHGGVLLLGDPGVLEGRLVDPDCYVRLMRVARLLDSGDWWDGLMPLLDAPHGLMMHWTRPFDLVVIVLSAPLMPFLPLERALFWGGALASPLLQVAAALLLVRAARSLVGRGGALLALLLFLVQPGVYGVYQIGRADHHSLQLTLAIAVLACLLLWSVGRTRLRLPLGAGLAAAAGLWTGSEALLTIAVAGGALGLGWLLRQEGTAAALWRFALGLALGTVAALALERPPGDWLAMELDRLSLIHIVLVAALLAAAGLVALAHRMRPSLGGVARLAVAGAAGLVAMLPMALAAPQFFAGPYGEIDPRVAEIFLSHVREAEPMLGRGRTTLPEAVFSLGALAVALPFALAAAWRDVSPRRLGWLLLAVAMVLYLAATLHQMRVLSYVQTALALPWAAVALAAWRLALGRLARPWRGPVAALACSGILLGPALAGVLLLDAGGRAAVAALQDRCDWQALGDWLDENRPVPDGTIATYVFPGPQIAWATGYGVISAPYHRNAAGILDVDRLFRAGDEEARAIAQARGLGLLVQCTLAPGRGGHAWYDRLAAPDGLYRRLAEERPPPWLERIGLDDPRLGDFRIWRVTGP